MTAGERLREGRIEVSSELRGGEGVRVPEDASDTPAVPEGAGALGGGEEEDES